MNSLTPLALSQRQCPPSYSGVVRLSSSLFVCLFVYWNKPRKTIFRSLSWEGSKMITHGQRHKPHAHQRQQHRPRTCQSMVNTLQVDGLAHITGLSGSHSTTHPQPPNGVPPCLVWCIGFGRGERLVVVPEIFDNILDQIFYPKLEKSEEILETRKTAKISEWSHC